MGHKINHSFKNRNVKATRVFHPRYGVIVALRAIRNITSGEELLLNYGYSIETKAPKWYYEAYLQEHGELPELAREMYEKLYVKPTKRVVK